MAKSHKAKVAKYCVRVTWPVYGAYDEITGSRSKVKGCSRSLAKAKALIAKMPGNDDVHFTIVKRVPGQRSVEVRTPQKSYPRPRRLRMREGVHF